MIRSLCFGLMAVLSFIIGTGLTAQTPLDNTMLSNTQKQALHREIASLMNKYQNVPIAADSPDFRLFAVTGRAARNYTEFVDELINLTVFQETPPDTTEKISPFRLSPAGSQLLLLGDDVRTAIRARQDQAGLTSWQNQVLDTVIHFIELRDRNSPQGARPGVVLDQRGETTQSPEISAPMNSPRAQQPPPSAPKNASEAKPTPQTSSEKTASSMPWSIVIVLIMAATGLLWLLLKMNRRANPE